MTFNELFEPETTLHHLFVRKYSESYRCWQLALLYAKGTTLEELRTNCEKGLIGGNLNDINLLAAAKNNLKYLDVNDAVTEEVCRELMFNLSNINAGPKISYEIIGVTSCAQDLIKDLNKFFETEKYNPSDTILAFCTPEEKEKINGILPKLYEALRYTFSVDLEFKSAGGTPAALRAEFATTESELSTGLSQRPVYEEEPAMWYDFTEETNLSCVTTGVSIPLSVAYINENNRIVEIVDRRADDSNIYTNLNPARYMLEASRGFFEKNNIKAGDECRTLRIIANISLSENDLSELKTNAVNGNSYFQYKYGKRLFFGEDSEKDIEDGLEWITRAADAGERDAVYCLGSIYFEGIEVPEDKEKGLELLLKACEMEQYEAAAKLGTMFIYGNYVNKDFEKGKELLELAAKKNNSTALYNLGLLYYSGNGVETDEDLAFFYFLKAARIGNPQAQYNAGLMYLSSNDVEKKKSDGIKWITRAAKNKVPEAMEFLDSYYKNRTKPDQTE